ncbi:cytochrome b5 domain-containing protein [Macrococcus sp. EM39E]|uniref:cytochrome b5 domain-containing protein n=1 Tax=Macrococcus animalis TaxID=3395467 RepID=UPI0039BEEAAF
MEIIGMIVGLCIILIVVIALLNRNKNNQPIAVPNRTITLDELTMNDGRNGNNAYIAIDNIVFDVSGSKHWENGEHHGAMAGRDITEAFRKSHHNDKMLRKMKAVGRLDINE